MSVMTAQANPNLEIIERVREGCELRDGSAGRCVNWIFDRLEHYSRENPMWGYREIWRAMKGKKAWMVAGFTPVEWQYASSYVSTAFDHLFQAPPKYHRTSRTKARRQGRRFIPCSVRGLVFAR